MNDLTLPGIANVHSHIFQRALRGGVQRRDPEREDSFWTWRQAMYELAQAMTRERLERVARGAYAECLEAGYTAVGEFHYLHRLADCPEDPLESSRVLLRAARQTGIRITLLWTVYHQGGFGEPLSPNQRPFASPDLEHVKRCLDTLSEEVDGARSRLGLAIHSVRAVPRSWLGPLSEMAESRGLVLHAHVSEQPAEVKACREATGMSPLMLLDAEGVLSDRFTAVHGTWFEDEDIAALSASGAGVCLCPTTEGDLGDGFPPTAALRAAGVPLSIGSDSHAVIDPFAELRTLEYEARARAGRRCILVDSKGQVAPALQEIGHHMGYRALGLSGATDRVHLDPNARAIQDLGSGPQASMSAAFTAGHPGLVREVEVAGEVVVREGRHVSC